MNPVENTTTPLSSAIARRNFLKLTVGTAAGMMGSQFLGLVLPPGAQATQEPAWRKNLILIITDQERTPMWFPPGWESANLPNTRRLQEHGLTFKYAFTAASMCTASRNSLFTGVFAARHHSPDTLTDGYPQSQLEHQLDPTLPNLATCLQETGYEVVYKGKWHMSTHAQAADGSYIEDDLTRYGFQGWDPPDAGGDDNATNFGGADAENTVKNDQRFVDDAVAFLTDRIAHPRTKPYCLIVSLVNPHDVISYPNDYAASQGGYQQEGDPWIAPLTPPIPMPPTLNEDLSGKPAAQNAMRLRLAQGLGPLDTPEKKRNYLNFYSRLMTAVDQQIGQILDVLDPARDGTGAALNEVIIIRSSDHGEMGLAHDGLRQKMFMAYEEMLRVPLIWSNPGLFPSAQDHRGAGIACRPSAYVMCIDRCAQLAGQRLPGSELQSCGAPTRLERFAHGCATLRALHLG